MPDKYKSILIKENKTVIFKSNSIKEEFNDFSYLPNALAACVLLSTHYKPQRIEDYIKETSGNNAVTLGVFKSKQNQALEDIENRKKFKILMYRGFISKFGITPLNFKKIFNALMMEIWNVKPYFSRYCYNNRGINEKHVRILHANLNLIKEAQSKGKNNIIPFVFYSGLSCEELPNFFDKKIWRILVSNSHSRNYLIASRIREHLQNTFLYKNDKKFSTVLKLLSQEIEFYNKIPSTVLRKTIYISGEDTNKESILALLNCLSIKQFLEEIRPNGFFMNGSFYTTVYQTIKNAKQIKKEYNLNWSKIQWEEKFHEYERINSPF